MNINKTECNLIVLSVDDSDKYNFVTKFLKSSRQWSRTNSLIFLWATNRFFRFQNLTPSQNSSYDDNSSSQESLFPVDLFIFFNLNILRKMVD